MAQFDPPGFLADLDETQRAAWSTWISQQLDEARDRNDPALRDHGPRLQFFNPLKSPADADAVEKDITWTAFPRILRLRSVSDRQRWRHADSSRDVQDEYCEWSVTRDPHSDKITRVTFTSEGPEYWQFLASAAPDKVVALYRQHISPEVLPEHLFPNGTYDPRNRWNNSTTNGAMHLIQANNTLSAEIELAASATIVRIVNGKALEAEQELIACGQYGQPERNSDPHIGAEVNALARAKADITLANPVGLCIAGLSTAGWKTPDGSPASDYWTVVRGTPEKALRAVYEVPAGKGFTVGDITVDGKTIEFGAQIADFITIKLTGLATRIGTSTIAPFHGCVRSPDAAVPPRSFADVAAALAHRPRISRR
jgi:hypothetical protein